MNNNLSFAKIPRELKHEKANKERMNKNSPSRFLLKT